MVRFDHAVIFVQDLDRAVSEFAAAGFDVRPGGVHAGGLTRNALIVFIDGSYLELLAFTFPHAAERARGLAAAGATGWVLRGRTALDRRFLPRAARGPGLIDWALMCDDLPERLTAAAGWLTGPFPGQRRRPDGVVLAWELAMPGDTVTPFLIRDLTDRALRVPAATEHPNGATGIAGMTVRCSDCREARRRYGTLLSREPITPDDDEVVRFDVSGVTVTLRPARGHAEGPVSVTLRGWAPADGRASLCGVAPAPALTDRPAGGHGRA